MKAVAFLQNMWVRDVARTKASIEKYGERWRVRAIHTFLFMGCRTGRNLTTAFGEDLLDLIYFEESTREIADNPRTIFPPQPDHIRAVLAEQDPAVVLTFGRIAAAAVAPLWSGRLITLPHPAARQPDTMDRLRAGAAELRDILLPPRPAT